MNGPADAALARDTLQEALLWTAARPGKGIIRKALGGVLSIEAGYHDSREDRDGSNPVIPNSQTRFPLGHQRSPWSDTIIGFQYYGEYMQRYHRYEASLPAGFPKQDRFRQVLTLRLMQSLKYQTWRLSFFTFWSPTDHDFYAIPELAHRLSDELSLALGANIFGGSSPGTFFGQLSQNDNLYFAARYDFRTIRGNDEGLSAASRHSRCGRDAVPASFYSGRGGQRKLRSGTHHASSLGECGKAAFFGAHDKCTTCTLQNRST